MHKFRGNIIVSMASEALGSIHLLVAVAEAECLETVVM
jgi:hypothetical protein